MKYLASLLILLTGCSSTPKYSEFKIEGPSAKLRVIALTKNTNAFYVSNDECSGLYHLGTMKNFLRNSTLSESSIGMPWIKPEDQETPTKNYREIVIPANKDFHLYYVAISDTYVSAVNAILKPEENRLYQINMSGRGVFAEEITLNGENVSGKGVSLHKPDAPCG